MDRFNIYLLDGNVLNAKVYDEPCVSLIFGPSKKISESLGKMHYNQVISLKYSIRNDEAVKEETIGISVGKLMEVIGDNYLALEQSQKDFHNSLENLIDGLELY